MKHTSETGNVTGTIGLKRGLDGIPLRFIGGPVTRINVDGEGDLQVNLCLLDGLKDETGEVAVGAVSADALRSRTKG